jgi:hypothetical protein
VYLKIAAALDPETNLAPMPVRQVGIKAATNTSLGYSGNIAQPHSEYR